MDGASTPDLDVGEIRNSPEFIELNSLITSVTQNDPFAPELTGDQRIKLRSLVNAVIQKANAGNTDQTDMKGAGVFRLIAFALFLLSKEAGNQGLQKRLSELELENEELKLQVHSQTSTNSRIEVEVLREKITKLEEQQVMRTRAIESNIVSRFAERLSLDEPNDEEDLVEVIDKKLKGKKKLVHEIVQAFGLPVTTHASNLVAVLKMHLGEPNTDGRVTNREIDDSLRQELLNVSNELIDAQEKIKALEMQLEKKEKHISRLRVERDETKNGWEAAVKAFNEESAQKESQTFENCAKFESARAELLQTRIEKEKLLRKVEKQERWIQTMEQKMAKCEHELKSVVAENKDLKAKVGRAKAEPCESKVVFEKPDVSELKQALALREDEKEKLMNLFETLATQFEHQTEELAEESKTRFSLVAAVQRLASVSHQLESQMELSETKMHDVELQNELLKAQIQEVSKAREPDNDSERAVLDAVLTEIETAPDEVKELAHEILDNEENTVAERIAEVVGMLMTKNDEDTESESDELRQLREHNQKLISAVSSELRFIEHLADSGEVQAWVLTPSSNEDVRLQLLSQCVRIEKFLQDNSFDLSESRDFFDYLTLDSNPLHLKSNLTEFLDEYRSPTTQEGKELFIMLIQALTANVFLRKYCEEAKSQCGHVMTELKALRNEVTVDSNHAEDVRQLQDDWNRIQQERATVENTKKKILAILQANIAEQSPDLSGIMKCITELKSENLDACDDTLYTQRLEERCLNAAQELTKIKEAHAEVVATTEEELEALKQEIAETTERSKQTIAAQEGIIAKLNDTIESNRKEIEGLQQTIAQLTQTNSDLKKQCENVEKEFGVENEAVRQEYDGIVRSLKKEMKLIEKGLEESIKVSDSEVQRLHNSIRKELARMNTEIEEAHAEKERMKSYYQEQIESMQQKLEIGEDREAELEDMVSKLKSDLKEAKSRISTVNIENKMLKTKLNGVDEKMQRERSIYESQMKLKLFAVESESQAKIDAFKTEHTTKLSGFMVNICHIFKEMVDMSHPINQETVLELLERVQQRLKTLDRSAFASEQGQLELQSIRQIIRCPEQSRVSTAVADLVKSAKQQAMQLEKLEAENKSMKRDVMEARMLVGQDAALRAWESWAKKLHSLVSDGFSGPTSPQEVRHAVEEVVLSSLGNRLMWRRLDCLRTEKRLLLSGLLNAKPKKVTQTLNQVIAVLVSIRRLQKLSGHARSSFGLPDSAGNDRKPVMKQRQAPSAPLFSRFVVDQTSSSRLAS